MRKREGEKRTNRLLIKHRDEFAREGKKNRILDEDTSVAPNRTMDEIAAGKGRRPSLSSRRRNPGRPQKRLRREDLRQKSGPVP